MAKHHSSEAICYADGCRVNTEHVTFAATFFNPVNTVVIFLVEEDSNPGVNVSHAPGAIHQLSFGRGIIF